MRIISTQMELNLFFFFFYSARRVIHNQTLSALQHTFSFTDSPDQILRTVARIPERTVTYHFTRIFFTFRFQ